MAEETWKDTCRSLVMEEIGLDDMTELEDVNDHSIAENLKLRLMHEQIYTCIGRVLIAVNPFKKLDIYDKRYVAAYHNYSKMKQPKNSQSLDRGNTLKCSTAKLSNLENTSEEDIKELPPHIYALTDNMYINMMIEKESQCVIISGESGAGKTISAKYIMGYLSEIASGGTKKIEEIKNIIVQSNPLLEAFGNAKTLRNNNSSRFGKFVEILFNMAGQPDGGKISNFLLEKSRVVSQNPGERNYHVFYQLLRGCSDEQKEMLGLLECDPEQYYYLNRTGGVYDVPDSDDAEEFLLTMNAMEIVGISEELKTNVLEMISAILHLGNIQFSEDNNVADVVDPAVMIIPSKLLGVDSAALKEKLVSRLMEARWGGKIDITMMTLNVEQAMVSRDALAKALYAQLFDFLVTIINSAMRKDKIELCIGVLDIYGFEIFEEKDDSKFPLTVYLNKMFKIAGVFPPNPKTNGFEQFCINFVNEKLQQIFVELTLKNEQEEYLEEGITWTPVKFFNNKLVCDLVESKNPPGIMSVLDDVCFTVHSSEGSGRTLMEKLKAVVGSENLYSKYFRGLSTHFEIHHYAGKVHYEATHFCERNKDVLFDDVIQLMQSSENEFIRSLFSDMPTSSGRRGRSSTGSSKIKAQCQTLIDRIMACTPHYVRCLKPNETKEPLDWHDHRILPQISYLGLRENIDVRRAGFAFRRIFDKINERYDIILARDVAQCVAGDKRSTSRAIMEAAQLSEETWKIGKTKVFMKESDMISKLELLRSAALFKYAAKLQSVVRGFLARVYCRKLRERIRAAKIIQRTFRMYVGLKNLNYRVLVKQYLKVVVADLEAELAANPEDTPEFPEYGLESPELESSELESPSITFTHTETTDHIGFYFDEKLQDITAGDASIFFTCSGKVYSKSFKMEKRLFILSMYHFYVICECSSSNDKTYTTEHKFSYQDLQSISVSILDTEFLVLKMPSFDLICESSHKNSLLAFLLAISSTTKEERPPVEKSDLISIHFHFHTESENAISLKFLKEGRSAYKEPRMSRSGKELTVTLPDPEEVLKSGLNMEYEVNTERYHDEDNQGVQGGEEILLSRFEQPHAVVQESEAVFTLSIELGMSGGKVACKGFELLVTESSSACTQTVNLDAIFQPSDQSYVGPGEFLLSPVVMVTNIVEQETELQLTFPFLSNLPEDVHSMVKWIRFFGSPSEGGDLVWRDIRSSEELSAFMVEIGDGYARLHTQENVMFCIVGSRDEDEGEQYYYGSGLEYSTYGDYDYNYGENLEEYGAQDCGKASVDPEQITDPKERFEAAAEATNMALQSPIPRPALGLPPPLPSSLPPPRPFPSPFDDVPLSEKKGKVKKSKTKTRSKSKKNG